MPGGAATVLAIAIFITLPLAAAPRFSDWSTPQNLGPPVSSPFADLEPCISKDGLSLYFASNRSGNFDIWVSQRASEDSPWEEPMPLPRNPPINTAALESIPTLSRDGHWLFFNSDRTEGGSGGVDIWASFRFDKHDDFGWQEPTNLGPGVNSPSFDGGAFLFESDDEERPLLFFGSDRQPSVGGIDIYVSEQGADGSFGPPRPVDELNTSRNDQRPVIRSDERELFFFSDRDRPPNVEDLWVSTRESVDDPWSEPVNLGPTVNSAFRDAHPFLASDRKTLFFSSNRPPGADCPGCASFDLYVTTRTKAKGPHKDR
jgi:hypothetical protein